MVDKRTHSSPENFSYRKTLYLKHFYERERASLLSERNFFKLNFKKSTLSNSFLVSSIKSCSIIFNKENM